MKDLFQAATLESNCTDAPQVETTRSATRNTTFVSTEPPGSVTEPDTGASTGGDGGLNPFHIGKDARPKSTMIVNLH